MTGHGMPYSSRHYAGKRYAVLIAADVIIGQEPGRDLDVGVPPGMQLGRRADRVLGWVRGTTRS